MARVPNWERQPEAARASLEIQSDRKNPDGRIAVFKTSAGDCLVFLPPTAPVGRVGRFDLVALTKPDGSAAYDQHTNQLYQGRAAPPEEIADHWVSRNGTLERCRAIVNYLGQTIAIHEVLESRPAKSHWTGAQREREMKSYSVQWGDRPNDLRLTVVETILEPRKQEVATFGRVEWADLRHPLREETTQFPIVEVCLPTGDDWVRGRRRMRLAHDLRLTVPIACRHTDGAVYGFDVVTTWIELPTWIRRRILAYYPPCHCQRERYAALAPAQYCWQCALDRCYGAVRSEPIAPGPTTRNQTRWRR